MREAAATGWTPGPPPPSPIAMDGDALVLQRPATVPRLQRARGAGRLVVKRGAEGSRLDRLFQDGSARIRFSTPVPGGCLDAVLINTAGGLAGGDHFQWAAEVGAGAGCTVVTQACEKVYRSDGEAAAVSVTLDVGEGGRLDWLPQETILFDRARLRRNFDVEVAQGARLLAAEAVILGRRAMGETVTQAWLHDRWRVRRAGRLVLADDLRFGEDYTRQHAAPSLLSGAGAFATVLLVDPDAEARLAAARAAIGEAGGASAFGGKLICRLLASSGMDLRRTLIPLLQALRDGEPVPRLWTV